MSVLFFLNFTQYFIFYIYFTDIYTPLMPCVAAKSFPYHQNAHPLSHAYSIHIPPMLNAQNHTMTSEWSKTQRFQVYCNVRHRKGSKSSHVNNSLIIKLSNWQSWLLANHQQGDTLQVAWWKLTLQYQCKQFTY